MKFAPVLALAMSACTLAAHADSFVVTYNAAGSTSSTVSNFSESFNSLTPVQSSQGSFNTTFNGSGITGTYSGAGGGYGIDAATLYGGAGGTGNFITTGSYTGTGTPYTLSLSSGVNYFGLWFSALDTNNQINFYNNNNLLFSFTSSQFINAVGTCPTNNSLPNAYCGNPSGQFQGQDSSQQYAFINFYDSTGSNINKIQFSQTPYANGDFESDNHTIGNISTAPGGTVLGATPEPSSLVLLGTGLMGFAGAARRRFSKRG